MSENTGAVSGSVFALRILALILAGLSLYNIVIPEQLAVGVSGLCVAVVSGVILPLALKQPRDSE